MSGPFFQDEIPAIERYPDVPGHKGRDTGVAAAEAMKPKAALLRDRVLAEIRKRPSTPDEVAGRLRLSVLSVRPRTTELSAQNLIVDTGERRENASGRKAIVWRAAAS
jgi:predicted ArsR family transcriptional regulator